MAARKKRAAGKRRAAWKRRWVTAAAAAGLVTLLAGCGSSGAPAASKAPATTNTPATTHAPATTTTPAPTTPAPTTPAPTTPATTPAPGAATLAAAYAATTRTRSARVSYRVAVAERTQAVNVTGGGVVGYHPEAAQIAIHTAIASQSVTLQERLIGNAVYVQLPVAARARFGASWLEISGLSGGASSTTGIDPSQTLALLEAGSSGIRRVGPAIVGGVPTIRYAATLQVAEALPGKPAFVQKAIRTFESSTGLTGLPVDVWIDQAGRVRQLSEDFGVPATATGAAAPLAGASFHIMMDLSDFGVPVHVTVPPISSIRRIDARRLLAGG